MFPRHAFARRVLTEEIQISNDNYPEDKTVGLTIHYSLKSKLTDADQVKQTVHQMRQLALDLPFEEVGEIVDLKGKQCDTEARRKELQGGDEKNESLFWLMIQAGQHVECPWN